MTGLGGWIRGDDASIVLVDRDGDSVHIRPSNDSLIVTCDSRRDGQYAEALIGLDDARHLLDWLTDWLEAAAGVEP